MNVTYREGAYRGSWVSRPDFREQCQKAWSRGGVDSPWGLQAQHQELSSGQACLITPFSGDGALCVTSPELFPSILPLGPNSDTKPSS